MKEINGHNLEILHNRSVRSVLNHIKCYFDVIKF